MKSIAIIWWMLLLSLALARSSAAFKPVKFFNWGGSIRGGDKNFNTITFAMKTSIAPLNYSLWCEFEIWADEYDIHNEFAIISVTFPNGTHYGINVWTYKYLETAVQDAKNNGDNSGGIWMEPPDLFVQEMTRDCIQQAIQDLMAQGNLEDSLNPSVGPFEPMSDEEVDNCFFDPPITLKKGDPEAEEILRARGIDDPKILRSVLKLDNGEVPDSDIKKLDLKRDEEE